MATFVAVKNRFAMKKYLLILFIAIGVYDNVSAQDSIKLCDCPAQSKLGKGTFYFMWGYNRDWFSKSDIHFKNTSGDYNATTGNYDSYDFTLYDVKAKDRPGLKDILRTDLTIPQYNYRLGYYFNDKYDLGVEINFDHTKYVMIGSQNLHLKGTIRGKHYDQDTIVGNDFLQFEHSDGANFLLFNIVKRQRLLVSKNKMHWLSGIIKFGPGMVIPRTDVTLFGQRLNNRFHIAGYMAGLETGLRYDFFKHFFMEYTAKGSWSNYVNVLVIGAGKANHHFFTFENILLLGVQFPL